MSDSTPHSPAANLPEHLGLAFTEARAGFVAGHFQVGRQHMAPNGFLHAASLIGLMDSACGYGCVATLPEGAIGFTTLELKSNFLSTVREGVVSCEARLVHGGRTTQVWDATATAGDKTLALFRCTQMILYPRA